ncbi:MAG TPA: amidohydrolase family protein [Bryobacteraceae bacterium]|nr:amidohydrolase family protein [Bryobacteraceae bacterium]
MRRRALVLGAIAGARLLAQPAPLSPDAPIVFQHVTIIDATGAAPHRNFSVLVSGGSIAQIAPKVKIPRGARKVDAKGKFMIPGLWDMHVHLGSPESFFPLLVANGITGVREMYSGVAPAALIPLRSRPDVPQLVVSAFLDGPRMLSNGPPPPGAAAVATADQARFAVRALAASGADFLKVYNSLPREAYFAIAQEARAVGIPFVGHVPEEVSPAEASSAGQRSQEHLINILLACSTREPELRAARIELMNSNAISGEQRMRELGFPDPQGLFDTYSEEKCAALFKTFVSNGTWHTPTLVLLQGFAHGDEFARDPRLASQPRIIRETPHPRQRFYMQDLSPEAYGGLELRVRASLERYQKLVGDMHRAGVEFLAGTDTSVSNPVLIGYGLHEELALLVESGLTPMEALQTATLNPARFFGAQDRMGTIEVGKAADLVLLDADPLRDIRNTQTIRAVVMHGRFFGRAELDEMLHRAAAN